MALDLKRGLLSLANAGSNINGSQFSTANAAIPQLDGKYFVIAELLKTGKSAKQRIVWR
jgi:cyclophilin family peptidyl-prolyl cis-trans isomerase